MKGLAVALLALATRAAAEVTVEAIGDPGAGGIFVIVLQSVVYLIGLVFCCGGLTYVVVQKNSGKSVWSAVPTLDPATLDPKSSVQMKKLAVTPDTTYSGSA